MNLMGKKVRPSFEEFHGLLDEEAARELAETVAKMREEDLAVQRRKILSAYEEALGTERVTQVKNLLERTRGTGRSFRQAASEFGIPYPEFRLLAHALGFIERD